MRLFLSAVLFPRPALFLLTNSIPFLGLLFSLASLFYPRLLEFFAKRKPDIFWVNMTCGVAFDISFFPFVFYRPPPFSAVSLSASTSSLSLSLLSPASICRELFPARLREMSPRPPAGSFLLDVRSQSSRFFFPRPRSAAFPTCLLPQWSSDVG